MLLVPGWKCRAGLMAGLLAGLVLTACGGNAQPLIVTLAPSATPTATETPRAAAGVVYHTSTPVPTRMPTTPTPGPSPTPLIAPTASPAAATLTATRAPTRIGLTVEYFTTDSEYVTPGQNVTLFWSTRGAQAARIFRVNDEGTRIFQWDVNIAGTLTIATRSSDREVARFVLEAQSGETVVEQQLLIPLRGPEVWFFDPPPDACPAGPYQFSQQAEQTFERGRMIWVQSQDRIYVIFEDGLAPRWVQYPDNFAEGDPERDDSLVAPPGLEQPVRGFGAVWRANPRVRERLGWANSPEIAFEGMIQADSAEPSVATQYLRMREGAILALNARTTEWTIIPAPGGSAGTP